MARQKQAAFIPWFTKRLYNRFFENRIPDLAAQLAYYFLLSLFPFLIFTVTLLGFYVSADDLVSLIRQYLPAPVIEPIEADLHRVLDRERGGLLSVGILATLWSASRATTALIRALNKAYNAKEDRPFVLGRSIAIGFTVALIFVIWVALVLPVFGKTIGLFLFSMFGLSDTFLQLWGFLRWAISFLIIVSVFIGLYYFAPNRRLTLKPAVIGALFTTICWQGVSWAFSYFVNNFANYSATYGSLGSIIVLMLWFYLIAMIMLVGGEVAATLYSWKWEGHEKDPSPTG